MYQYGINFNELPNWHKRGIGIYWKDIDREGFNPITKEKVITKRRELFADLELPMKEEYELFIKRLIGSDNAKTE